MIKQQINILIVDDYIDENRLNDLAKEYFEFHLKKEGYSFTVKIIDESITNSQKLWTYLDDTSKIFPDFILLDWVFENEGDINKNKNTGKDLLAELMRRKRIAHRGETNGEEIKEAARYKNLEVITMSSYIKLPQLNNLEDMLLGGAIAAAAKTALKTDNEFLIQCLKKWVIGRELDITPNPTYDGDRFGELKANFITLWVSARQYILNKGDKFEDSPKPLPEDIQRLVESSYFPFFQNIVLGIPKEKMPRGHKEYYNQSKYFISNTFLNEIPTGETHRWIHFAIEHRLEFITEYLAEKGYVLRTEEENN